MWNTAIDYLAGQYVAGSPVDAIHSVRDAETACQVAANNIAAANLPDAIGAACSDVGRAGVSMGDLAQTALNSKTPGDEARYQDMAQAVAAQQNDCEAELSKPS